MKYCTNLLLQLLAIVALLELATCKSLTRQENEIDSLKRLQRSILEKLNDIEALGYARRQISPVEQTTLDTLIEDEDTADLSEPYEDDGFEDSEDEGVAGDFDGLNLEDKPNKASKNRRAAQEDDEDDDLDESDLQLVSMEDQSPDEDAASGETDEFPTEEDVMSPGGHDDGHTSSSNI